MICVLVKTQKTYHPGFTGRLIRLPTSNISFPCGAGRGGSQQLLNGNLKWGRIKLDANLLVILRTFPHTNALFGVGNCNDPWNFQLVSSQVVSNPHV